MTDPSGNFVRVTNEVAGTDIYFHVEWDDGHGKQKSKNTGYIGPSYSEVVNLDNLSIPPNTTVYPVVNALASVEHGQRGHTMIYSPGAGEVDYRAHGSLDDFGVD